MEPTPSDGTNYTLSSRFAVELLPIVPESSPTGPYQKWCNFPIAVIRPGPLIKPPWEPPGTVYNELALLHGKTGRGKTPLAVAIGYRAIPNGSESFCTTAAELIEHLSNAIRKGQLQQSLFT